MLDGIGSPYIHAADSDNFRALVLENSNQGPVLVNFWSRKAGPCLRQYPVLDKVVHHYDGRVLLINVDTEHEFIFTKEYGVTSVPTLKLFRNEHVVETLHGYQSEADLIKLLDQYVARDSDSLLVDAIELYSAGQQLRAYEMIAEAIVDDPVNPRLPLTMCKLLLHEGRYDDASRLIESLPEKLRKDREIGQLYDSLFFYMGADPAQDITSLISRLEASPDELAVRQQLVMQLVIQKQYETALKTLVEIMEIDQHYDNNFAQQAMLKIFNILGPGNELVRQYRPNLTRYTF